MIRKELETQLIERVREVLSTPGMHPAVYDMYSEYLATGSLSHDPIGVPVGISLYEARLRGDLRYALLALECGRNDVFLANLAEMKYDLARAKEHLARAKKVIP